MLSHLLLALLTLSAPHEDPARSYEITAEVLEAVGTRAREAVEAQLGVDLSEYARFELGTTEDVKAVLDIELVPQFKLQFPDPVEAERNLEVFSKTFASMLLAKYSYGDRTILVMPQVFEDMAEALNEPGLMTEETLYAVLVHEAVHAAQDQAYGWEKTLDLLETTNQLKAFNAVAEGHAQWIAKTICSESPAREGWEVFTRSIGAGPARLGHAERLLAKVQTALIVTAYHDGRTFIAKLHELGGQEAVDRAFSEPPADLGLIYHPAWFLDPELRPKHVFDLEAGLAPMNEAYPAPQWNHQELDVDRPQIEAGFSILPKEEVAEVLGTLRAARLHIAVNSEDVNQNVIPVLMEVGSPEEAVAVLDLEERLLRKKDEVMAEGDIRITSAEYREIQNGGFRGLIAEKTVSANGQELFTKSIVMTRAALVIELTVINLEVSDEDLNELASKLLTAAMS